MIRRWLIAFLAVLALSTDAWASGEARIVLWAVNDEAKETMLGVMSSEEACLLVADALRRKYENAFICRAAPPKVRT